MPRLFLPVLPALFLLMLAACEPQAGIDTEAVAPPAQVELAVHAVQRCPRCGWIESKREIVSSVAEPHSLGIYEYTLRMTDGSSTVFREALPASWRLGERLTVIDGTRPGLE
jgi:hypothetical protein